jgi:hypothetical protein
VSFTTITLCVASRRVFIVVVYFVIDSVRKLLDTPSYAQNLLYMGHVARMEQMRNAYKTSVRNPEGNRPIGRCWRRWQNYINILFVLMKPHEGTD